MFLPLRDHNPTVRRPVVTVTFIALNVLVFLLQRMEGPDMIARWGATPLELTQLKDLVGVQPGGVVVHVPGPAFLPITAFSSMFLHGGWMHLGFNMLYLWIFGNNVEDFLGHLRFVLFYILTGLAGLVAHVALHPSSDIPVVGASGAISGVLGAYLVLYPRARVDCLMFLFIFIQVIQVPAVVLLGVWIAMQFFGGLSALGGGAGVAYWAHIGGFVAGWIAIRRMARRYLAGRRMRAPWRKDDDPPPPPGGPSSGSDPSEWFRQGH